MRSFCRALLIAALVLSVGLHWAVLQSAAWVGMIVNYARDGSVGEAIQKTFDGQHPCALCRLVEHGTSKEKGPQKKAPDPEKVNLSLVMADELVIPAPGHPDFAPPTARPTQRRAAPPVPPPRAA